MERNVPSVEAANPSEDPVVGDVMRDVAAAMDQLLDADPPTDAKVGAKTEELAATALAGDGAIASEVANVIDAMVAPDVATGSPKTPTVSDADGVMPEQPTVDLQQALEDLRCEMLASGATLKATARDVARLQTDLQTMRTDVDRHDSALVRLGERVEDLVRREEHPVPVVGISEGEGGAVTPHPLWVLGGSVLLLTWALVFYLRTGNLKIALGSVVLANLVTCSALLWMRRRSAAA